MNDRLAIQSRQVLAHHGRTFRLAGRLLPAAQLDAAAVVYAWCRRVDDAVDEAPSEEQARTAIAATRASLEGAGSVDQLTEAARLIFEGGGIGVGPALELVMGMEQDLDEVRFADDAELLTYCYRAAGTVGLMMCAVFGVTDPIAHRHAIDLGVAMQLTNICRDVREDADRLRVYLPASRLAEQGITHDDVLAYDAHPDAMQRVVHGLLGMADDYYRSGEDGLHHLPWRARWAILAASRMYRQIGVRLLRRGRGVWAGRTVVPLHEKIWAFALGAWNYMVPRRRPSHRTDLHRLIAGLPGAVPRGEL